MQGRDVAIVIGAVVLVLLLLGLLGGGMMMGPMMGWGGFGFGWVILVIFWALIIGGVAALLVWLFQRGRPVGAGPTGGRALEILRERYARGEITREEFERMRHDLEER